MSWREDVRQIDWGAFEGAYGPAKDLPRELDRLCSPDEEHDSLSFMHQGDVYEVTPQVIPFLVAIAQDTSVALASRTETLNLLLVIAESEPPSIVAARYDPFTKREEPANASRWVELARWIRASQTALRAETPRLTSLTKDGNTELRQLAVDVIIALSRAG